MTGTSLGTWETVTYDGQSFTTWLTDSAPAPGWAPQSLRGLFIEPDTSVSPILLYPVIENTVDTIFVAGDLSGIVSAGAHYVLHDYHLGAGSVCIDAGTDLTGLTSDIEGLPRHKVLAAPPSGAAGAPNYPDLGAYEYY
jgi:hypothetical protein